MSRKGLSDRLYIHPSWLSQQFFITNYVKPKKKKKCHNEKCHMSRCTLDFPEKKRFSFVCLFVLFLRFFVLSFLSLFVCCSFVQFFLCLFVCLFVNCHFIFCPHFMFLATLFGKREEKGGLTYSRCERDRSLNHPFLLLTFDAFVCNTVSLLLHSQFSFKRKETADITLPTVLRPSKVEVHIIYCKIILYIVLLYIDSMYCTV